MNWMLSLLTRGNSVRVVLFVFSLGWGFLHKAYGHPLVTCCGPHVLHCSVASAHWLAAADSFAWSVRLAQEDILSQPGSAPEELDGFQYSFVRFNAIWNSVIELKMHGAFWLCRG